MKVGAVELAAIREESLECCKWVVTHSLVREGIGAVRYCSTYPVGVLQRQRGGGRKAATHAHVCCRRKYFCRFANFLGNFFET